MNQNCGFCNKVMEIINHTNSDIFDIYLCEGCLKPEFDTRYRIVCYKNLPLVLANTIRIDEWFIVNNHMLDLTKGKINYTRVYQKVIGEFNDSLDLTPLTMGPDQSVFELDFVLDLPLHDPALVKRKLQIYTTFS